MAQAAELIAFFQDLALLFTHGMRNRLTPAVTSIELLEDFPPVSGEKYKTALGLSSRSLASTLTLLGALDDFWQIVPGNPEQAAFQDLVQACAHDAQIELVIAGRSVRAVLDTALWRTILQELFLNVKHHGGGKASVSWQVEGSRIQVEVADNGPGLGHMLPEKAMEATRRSETSQGSGMGLSKAAYAALLLGGQVSLRNGNPAGVTAVAHANFTSDFPAMQPPVTPAAKKTGAPASLD